MIPLIFLDSTKPIKSFKNVLSLIIHDFSINKSANFKQDSESSRLKLTKNDMSSLFWFDE
jgi:hypothetical protein